jgi:hypothetical protein
MGIRKGEEEGVVTGRDVEAGSHEALESDV